MPAEFLQEMRDMGLFSLVIPEEHGQVSRPTGLPR